MFSPHECQAQRLQPLAVMGRDPVARVTTDSRGEPHRTTVYGELDYKREPTGKGSRQDGGGDPKGAGPGVRQ